MKTPNNPFIVVDTSAFEAIQPHQKLQVSQFEPDSKRSYSATFCRTSDHFVSIRLREWCGDRFRILVNLKHGIAQVQAPVMTGVPGIDHLTKAAICSCRRLLRHENLLD